MADIDPQIIQEMEKEFRTLAKDTAKYRRNLGSSIATVAKGAKTRKEQNEILKIYTKGLKQQLATEEALEVQNKDKIKLIKSEIKETESLAGKFGILGKAVAFVGKLFMGFAKGTLETAKMMLDAGQEVKGFGGLLKHYGDEVPFFGKGLMAIAESLDFTVANFKTLAQQGADFGQNMIAMKEAAGAANMPLLQFVDLMHANTQSFARFFGTTNQGIPAIAAMARSMRDFTKKELAQFGLNFTETNEYMATYLELQRSTGRAETMSTQQLITGSQNYVKQLVRLAKLTGQSTDELNKQMEQQKQNGVLAAALAKRAPEEADRLRKLVTSLGGATSAYGGLAVDMIAAGAPMTEVSRKLAGANSDILNTITKFINDPSTDISATISNVRQASNQFLKDFPQAAAYFSGEFITILDNAAAEAGKTVGESVSREMKKETDAGARFTASAVGFAEQIDKAKSNAEMVTTAFMDMATKSGKAQGILDAAGAALVAITQKAEDLAGTANSKFTFNGGALKVWVVGWGEKIWNKAKDMGSAIKKDFTARATDDKGLSRFWGDQKEGNSAWDILTPWNTQAEKDKIAANAITSVREIGTRRTTGMFSEPITKNMTVHTGEKVLNKSETVSYSNDISQMTETINVTKQIAESNERIANHLNKLLTVGIMTEKNTNKTKISLEGLRGTLV
jgi:hypothetical protein|tara:strand:+ start:1149 stop:3188 length:2040 start_codon:yes stop_codon:yes gene_type:complete